MPKAENNVVDAAEKIQDKINNLTELRTKFEEERRKYSEPKLRNLLTKEIDDICKKIVSLNQTLVRIYPAFDPFKVRFGVHSHDQHQSSRSDQTLSLDN